MPWPTPFRWSSRLWLPLPRSCCRPRAVGTYCGFVHAGVEVVAGLLLDFAARRIGLGGLLEYAPQQALVLMSQLAIDFPARLIRRDGIPFDPAAASVLKEIGTGVDGLVHRWD